VAETLDLLGMASVLGGDLNRSVAYYDQAVALLRGLDDRQGLDSSLASIVGGGDYLSDTMAPGEGVRSERLSDGETALEIARQINYRSGEAYALLALGFALGPIGDYARALEYAQAGLGVAEEIEHHQWMAMAHCALGALHLDLLALSQAQEHLERALALSKEIGSLFWMRCVTGFLASTCIQRDELMLAESLLNAAVEPGTPLETMGQRLIGCARAELALAAGERVRRESCPATDYPPAVEAPW
jgi:tetratricopeptide (TPR) repeat protein